MEMRAEIHTDEAAQLINLTQLKAEIEDLKARNKQLSLDLERKDEQVFDCHLDVEELEEENKILVEYQDELRKEKRRLEKENKWFYWGGIAITGVILFTPDIAHLIKMFTR